MITDYRIRSIMETEIHTIDADASIAEARVMLNQRPFHHLPITSSGKLVGILSSIDLARLVFDRWAEEGDEDDENWHTRLPVKRVMTPAPKSVGPDDPIRVAADLLSDGVYHALPVIDSTGKLCGIVTTTDLVRLLARELKG